MAERRPPHTPPSAPDGDGVRVVRKSPEASRARTWALLVAAIAALAVLMWIVLARAPEPGTREVSEPVASREAPPTTGEAPPLPARAVPPASIQEPEPMPGNDPDDLAAYFRPGDPEPSGAEVIEGLQAAGVRTGLGAFNPPGTSPPLEGLAVPDDFPLPEGYVRHHQVTDEGEPIEPILMFSPDFNLYDAKGRPIEMPADRVVPPELAPPGLPLRRVRVGKP